VEATVLPPDSSLRFRDVDQSASYREAIETLANVGIVEGYGDGRFGPTNPVPRQQFAKMIAKTLQLDALDFMLPNYEDLPK